jgi:membrane protease YdiL (CAAX protease family)
MRRIIGLLFVLLVTLEVLGLFSLPWLLTRLLQTDATAKQISYWALVILHNLALAWFGMRILTGRSWLKVINSTWFNDLVTGLALGAGTIIFVMISMLAFGAYELNQWNPNFTDAAIGISLIRALSIGLSEELLLRGFLQSYLEKKTAVSTSLWIQAFLFGILHMGNVNSILGFVYYMLAGFALTLLAIRYQTIWAAVGVHVALNFLVFYTVGFSINGVIVDGALINFVEQSLALPTFIALCVFVIYLTSRSDFQHRINTSKTS